MPTSEDYLNISSSVPSEGAPPQAPPRSLFRERNPIPRTPFRPTPCTARLLRAAPNYITTENSTEIYDKTDLWKTVSTRLIPRSPDVECHSSTNKFFRNHSASFVRHYRRVTRIKNVDCRLKLFLLIIRA